MGCIGKYLFWVIVFVVFSVLVCLYMCLLLKIQRSCERLNYYLDVYILMVEIFSICYEVYVFKSLYFFFVVQCLWNVVFFVCQDYRVFVLKFRVKLVLEQYYRGDFLLFVVFFILLGVLFRQRGMLLVRKGSCAGFRVVVDISFSFFILYFLFVRFFSFFYSYIY